MSSHVMQVPTGDLASLARAPRFSVNAGAHPHLVFGQYSWRQTAAACRAATRDMLLLF
ncbi:hypothetical protein PZN02_004306 [Sinorhizobium garamanticum]|uniref:Uncharacterized protein n=1 Tax=Sinorhizobium garamanticum TaxID=680247 RepID=A0ABY8DMG1_9HYPH|nr:hypothetical protein [Sinorhizobium garamanticum]WEX90745.1 hypothetical protein PZN02_004306 [Sinorhizobium garamanticum]